MVNHGGDPVLQVLIAGIGENYGCILSNQAGHGREPVAQGGGGGGAAEEISQERGGLFDLLRVVGGM